VIPLPFDAATAPYNLERRTAAEAAKPPAFGADDALTVKAGSTYRTFTLAFPEVAENAFTYWITVQRWQGNAWTNLVETEIFSEFWKQTAAKTGRASVTVTDDAFEPGADYRFCVQPVGQYGTKGVAITATATAATAGDKPDGFVEYVRLTSTQYFDTGIIGRSGTKAEVDFKLDKTGDDWSLLDCRKDETDSRFFLFHTSGGFAAYGYGKYKRQDAYPLVSGRRYLAASELKAGLQTIDLDGKRIVTATDAQTIDTGINLFLGACNFPSRGKPLYASMARIYALKLWQTDANGTYRLVRDFVPCMAAGGLDAGGVNRRTRVGALYDRVSGRIFFAHSASDYSAGVAGSDTSAYLPDVWNSTSQGRPDFFVKYIRSTGSQILDTGVPARAGLRVEGDLMYTAGESGPEAAYLGTSCSAYAMIVDRPSSGTAWGGFGTYGVSTRYLTNETTQTAARWELNRDYHIAATYGKSGESTIVQNGATIYRQSNVAQTTGQNLMMFASRRDNWPAYTAHARCYGLKDSVHGTLALPKHPFSACGKRLPTGHVIILR